MISAMSRFGVNLSHASWVRGPWLGPATARSPGRIGRYHRRMPDPDDSEPTPDASELASDDSPRAEATASVSGRRRIDRGRDRKSLLTAAVAVLAVIAVATSAWAVLRPASGAGYDDAQKADAKAQVCSAFDTVRRGISRNTNLQVPSGDVAASLGAAANARISLYDGGQYLLARLGPATPTELADTVRGFANSLLDIGSATVAGALDSDPDQATRLAGVNAANAKIGQICA
jgi:hypothetical protein